MVRKLVVAAVLLAVFAGCFAAADAQLIPDTHKYVGTVGSVTRTFMSVVKQSNEMKIFHIPYDFKMPREIMQGVKVRVTYRIADGKNVLATIKKL